MPGPKGPGLRRNERGGEGWVLFGSTGRGWRAGPFGSTGRGCRAAPFGPATWLLPAASSRLPAVSERESHRELCLPHRTGRRDDAVRTRQRVGLPRCRQVLPIQEVEHLCDELDPTAGAECDRLARPQVESVELVG